MIEVRYIGTGDAFDERSGNTSLIYRGARRVLLDCGYAVPHALWRIDPDPDDLDAIYISHFHADHAFGLPAVLARMSDDGRERPLLLLGGPGSAEAARAVLQLGYPRILEKLRFALSLHEIAPGERFELGPVTLRTARSAHSLDDHAVRLEDAGQAVCYSGDGAPTAETETLYTDADLLVHEAYYPEPREKRTHASAAEVVDMARRVGVKALHLVHFERTSPRAGVAGAVIPAAGETYRV